MPPEPVPECPFLCRVESQLGEILTEMQAIRKAFPEDDYGDADFPGHRQFHEARIAAAEAEKAFWQELRLDLAKKGAWTLLIIIVGFTVAGILAKLGIGVRP